MKPIQPGNKFVIYAGFSVRRGLEDRVTCLPTVLLCSEEMHSLPPTGRCPHAPPAKLCDHLRRSMIQHPYAKVTSCGHLPLTFALPL